MPTARVRLSWSSIAALAAIAASTPTARAGVALEQFGGWEGDSRGQGFAFMGTGLSVPAGHHVRVPVSVSGSYLYYAYDSSGTAIAVRSPGASLTTGIRAGGARGSVSLMAGVETRWERRETQAATTAADHRTSFGAVVQTYDDLVLDRRWYASAFGIYVGAARYLIGRGALRLQVTNLDWTGSGTCYLGIEAVRQGNDLSNGTQAGGFVEWGFPPRRISIGLHAGYKESGSPGYPRQRGAYAGISVYRGS